MIIAGVYTLIALVTFLGIGAILRRLGLLNPGCLMDTGDGQGGVPPLPRRDGRLATLGDYVTARQAAAAGLVEVTPRGPAVIPGVDDCQWCVDDDEDFTRQPTWWDKKCTCGDACEHPACPAPGGAA